MPRAFSGGLVCVLPPRRTTPIACFGLTACATCKNAVPATSSCRAGCGAAAIPRIGEHNRAIHADLQLVRAIVPQPDARAVAGSTMFQLIWKPELILHTDLQDLLSPGRQTVFKNNPHTYHDKKSHLGGLRASGGSG